MTDEHASGFQFDDVRVEPRAFKIFKAGVEAELEPKAFKVLLFLIENRGRLIEKGEILDAVWRDTHVTENAMTREIAKLRKLLGDNAKEPKYIETVHTRGYRFIAEVVELNGHAPQEISVGEDTTGPTGNNGHSTDSFKESPRAIAESVSTRDAARAEVSAAGSSLSAEEASPPVATRRRSRWARARRVLMVSVTLGLLLFGAFMLGVYLVWKYALREEPRAISPKVTRVTTYQGLDVNPTLSPDGSAVAYSSDHNGAFELYVKPLVPGGREVQLTNDGAQNFDPAWSPDGKLIAYHSLRRGGVWLVPALGGVARQLTEFGAHPAWSRDGAWLAFQSEGSPDIGALPFNTSTLWLISAQGGAPRQITRAGVPAGSHLAPAWFPDGKHIAFLGANARVTQIWVTSTDGGEPKQLTAAGTGDKGDPVFSPDGAYLYFTRAGVLWRRKVATGGERLTDDLPVKVADMGDASIHHLSFSADGKRLAYSAWTQTSNLWSLALAANTGTPAALPARLTNETGTRNTQPAFAPDGKRIAFVEGRRGGAHELWAVDSDGKNVAPLATLEGGQHFPKWLASGDRVAFEMNNQGRRALVAVSTATGRQETLAELGGTIEFPQLSPDARRIAFNIREGSTVNVATMDVGGTEVKQLTFDKEMIGNPCWSPDGRLLAVQVQRGADTHVAVMPGESGEVIQLTYARGQSWPYGWSPDGGRILFAAEREGVWNLWWVSRADKTVKQLTNNTKLNAYVRYPAWSPLGNQIVYEYAETTGNIYVLD